MEDKKKTQNSVLKNIQKEKTVAKKNDFKNRKITKKESTEKKKTKMVKSARNKFISEKKSNQTENDSTVEEKNRPSRKKSKNISYKESDESDFEEEDKVSEKKLKICKKTLASKVSEKMSSSSSPISSDDFEESIKFTSSKRTESKADHKIISSSSSNASFADNQEKSVDCVNMVFDDVSHFENLDSRPLTYILSFDNDNLLKQPLPKTISEYKNHPLYVLKRHLLKFEAIYPNSAVPLGYLKNEPIYARECVHQLHARETWMKDGRNVKGKIPRNEYGNVELYKPSMLPGGTVHLKEPGLNRIARKLGIDCAAAMVGWDFHGGSSHPVFDGWIVCVEHEDMILKEWEKDQERTQLREIEEPESIEDEQEEAKDSKLWHNRYLY
ncbi:XPC [Acanthosepion pharaonis]|uniref:XPC n=1 Tax=Acanthosepion pharaonis TaxID=158019 RepID=A0A812DP92_ACAPH|nr:XPC [Sepia pharaonis]